MSAEELVAEVLLLLFKDKGQTELEILKTQQFYLERVEFINANASGDVAASGGLETVNVKAPSGYIYELLTMRLQVNAPAGATAGTHYFKLQSEAEYIDIMRGTSTFGSAVKYDYSHWLTANNAKLPTEEASALACIKNLRIDDTNGIDIIYYNNTDAIQKNDRLIRLWVRKIKVG